MPDLRFVGRVAIVAGSGPADVVAREIRDQDGDAVADSHNVATRDGGEQIVRTALETYGQLDILVNTAGSSTPGRAAIPAPMGC